RDVAIKVLREDAVQESSVRRFLSEIEVIARLHHPLIAPLFDSGEAAGRPFYVMPLFEGETLRARLLKAGRLAPEEAVAVATDVAEALMYAHERGVVHRDIKPENILMESGHAVVADFGIARAAFVAAREDPEAPRLPDSYVLGTPPYMSPEQYAGSDLVDGRSDVFGLGVVLYEMLTGALPPTPGGTPSPRGASPRAVEPGVPAALDAVVSRASAFNPADRFPSARAMHAALRQAIGAGGKLTPVRLGAALGGGIILAFVLAVWRPWQAIVPPLSHGRVVVATLSNETDDSTLDAIGSQAADLITERISKLADMRVATSAIERPALRELQRTGSPARDPEALRKLASETGAGYVVSGSYYRVGNHLEFFVEVTDAVEGLLARAIGPLRGTAANPDPAIDSAATLITVVLDSLARYHAPRR
ncbi:MAG: protein kinase, partial [Acidobacteria bacterium]|nr:protein kinase [Acidobacteriota bacterium]